MNDEIEYKDGKPISFYDDEYDKEVVSIINALTQEFTLYFNTAKQNIIEINKIAQKAKGEGDKVKKMIGEIVNKKQFDSLKDVIEKNDNILGMKLPFDKELNKTVKNLNNFCEKSKMLFKTLKIKRKNHIEDIINNEKNQSPLSTNDNTITFRNNVQLKSMLPIKEKNEKSSLLIDNKSGSLSVISEEREAFDKLKKEYDELKKENIEYKEKIELYNKTKKEEEKEKEDLIKQLKDENEKLSKELTSMEVSSKQILENNTDLSVVITNSKKTIDQLLKENTTLSQLNKEYVNELVKIKNKLNDQSPNGRVKQLQDQISRIKNLYSQNESAYEEKIKNSNAINKQLNNEITSLKKTVIEKNNKIKELEQSIKDANDQYQNIQVDTEKNIYEYENKAKVFETRNEELIKEMQNKEIVHNRLLLQEQNKNKVLEDKISDLNIQIQSLEMTYNNEIDDEQNKNKELEDKIKELTSSSGKNEILEQKINELHEEIERIKSENGLILKEEQNKNLLYEEKINVLEAKIKAINRKSENEKEDYEEEIAREKKKNSKLENQVKTLQKDIDDLYKSKKEQDSIINSKDNDNTIKLLNSQIKERDNEIKEKEEELTKKENTNKELNNQIELLNQKIKDLDKKTIEIEKEKDTMIQKKEEEHKNELDKQNKTISEYKKQIENYESRLKSAIDNQNNLILSLDKEKRDVTMNYSKTIEEKTTQLEQMKSLLETKQKEKEDSLSLLNTQIEQKSKELSETQIKLTHLNDINNDLNKKISSLTEQISSLQSEMNSNNNKDIELSKIKIELNELKSKKEELLKKNEEQQKEIEALKLMNDELNKKVEKSEKTINEYENTFADVSQKIDEYKIAKQNYNDVITTLQKEIECTKEENKTEKAILQSEYKKTKEELDSLKSKLTPQITSDTYQIIFDKSYKENTWYLLQQKKTLEFLWVDKSKINSLSSFNKFESEEESQSKQNNQFRHYTNQLEKQQDIIDNLQIELSKYKTNKSNTARNSKVNSQYTILNTVPQNNLSENYNDFPLPKRIPSTLSDKGKVSYGISQINSMGEKEICNTMIEGIPMEQYNKILKRLNESEQKIKYLTTEKQKLEKEYKEAMQIENNCSFIKEGGDSNFLDKEDKDVVSSLNGLSKGDLKDNTMIISKKDHDYLLRTIKLLKVDIENSNKQMNLLKREIREQGESNKLKDVKLNNIGNEIRYLLKNITIQANMKECVINISKLLGINDVSFK